MFEQVALKTPTSIMQNLKDSIPIAIAKGQQKNVPSLSQQGCVSKFDLLQRRVFQTFDGPTFVSVTGKCFPWVVATQVPTDRYWVLFHAALLSGPLEIGPNLEPGLWVLPRQGLRPNVGILDGTDPFFKAYSTVVKENYGPPAQGLRIDDGVLNASSDFNITVAGQELAAFKSRKYILVGPGEQLMGYCVNDAAAPPNGNQLELRICYTELQVGEDFDQF